MASQHVSVKQAFGLSVGSEIILRGWVRSRRDSKGITFIEINDGSRFKSMQLVVDAGIVPDETLKQVTTGSSISATGVLVESPAKGQAVELKVAAIHVYGGADPATYPLQKKGHTLEFLREISHLRVRSNTFGAAFRVRNALTHAIHSFFQERDFIYVQTPIITTSDCEGAGQMFGVTTLNLQQPPHDSRRQSRLAAGFLRQTGLPHRERPARRRNLSPRRFPKSTPSVRRFAPRTATRRAIWPSSG